MTAQAASTGGPPTWLTIGGVAATLPRPATGPAERPADPARRGPRTHPARHRGRSLGRGDRPGGHPAGHPRRMPTLTMLTGGIDLSVGMSRLDGGLHPGHPDPPAGPGGRHPAGPRRGGHRRADQRHRRRRLQGPPADHDPRSEPRDPGRGDRLTSWPSSSPARWCPTSSQWLGSETMLLSLPNSLLLFVPLAVLIMGGLRYSGYGRLLFAVGDNAVAARLSGVRVWAVLLGLYLISALLAAVAGLLPGRPVQDRDRVTRGAVRAPRGGCLGHRWHVDPGWTRRLFRHHPGGPILTVVSSLLLALQMPEAARQVLFGLIIVAVAAAYTRVTGDHERPRRDSADAPPRDRLGGTNCKWVVLEHVDDAWTVLDRVRSSTPGGWAGRRRRSVHRMARPPSSAGRTCAPSASASRGCPTRRPATPGSS